MTSTFNDRQLTAQRWTLWTILILGLAVGQFVVLAFATSRDLGAATGFLVWAIVVVIAGWIGVWRRRGLSDDAA
jgi:hypothetical protein